MCVIHLLFNVRLANIVLDYFARENVVIADGVFYGRFLYDFQNQRLRISSFARESMEVIPTLHHSEALLRLLHLEKCFHFPRF